MDLSQRKLTKQEWEGIEVPVSSCEKEVLKMICEGFYDINIKHNKNNSLMTFAKLDQSDIMELHIFETYFKKRLQKIYKKSCLELIKHKSKGKLVPKKRDLIRLENVDNTLDMFKDSLYEFTILDLIEKLLSNYNKKRDKWLYYYYTLTHLQNIHLKMNKFLKEEVDVLLEKYEPDVVHNRYFENAESVLEKNEVLLQYTDMELYEHQKRIFSAFKSVLPKLVLYVAPTGTGKTLTPIGLSEKYRIIFVCAARHVGLALAKSAISANKKIALAFNCADADDIRLHFAAAKEFTKNYKTGGIYRVDNSVGDNVEIMISDVESYIIAMRYMTAFNKKEQIITYWDEPTITMDYDNHPFHEIIHRNWCDNVIPNIVLSSATLPREEEIRDVLADYISRFEGDIRSIVSADCNNSIPLISKEGNVTLPHHLPDNSNYENMLMCIEHCKKSSNLIRYMDLKEICRFILYVNENGYLDNEERLLSDNYFESTNDITIKNIKFYYLKVIEKINQNDWGEIYDIFQKNRQVPFESNILITTKDAHTLTYGPSIYLANDIEKVARFYLQQSKIPASTIDFIHKQVEKNDKINNDIEKLEMTFENTMEKEMEKDKKMADDNRMPPEMKQLRRKIEELQQRIQSISMPEIYIPNSPEHLFKWAKDEVTVHSFTPQISDEYVIKLMRLNDIEPMWKLLLLMGIGVFMKHESIGYVEIMKELAQQQKLILILATDDYIYGTNYQFCHGYLGKDLIHLTQEKIIQAIGRVGRNKQCKDYSIRMRDNIFIDKIFKPLDVKKEAEMMNRLFTSE